MEDNIKTSFEEEQNDIQIYENSSDIEFESSVENKKNSKKGLGAILTVLVLVLGKFKFLVVILQAFKITKFIGTISTMAITVWMYTKTFGFYFAFGFVLLIYFHEMGHYLTAKQEKLDVSAPLFIPFVGAFIKMKEVPKNIVIEAKTAIGGPLLGSFAAVICFFIYLITKNELFLGLAYTGFIVNLFNLIPAMPLDGGRIASIISPKIWFVGIPIMMLMLFKFFSPIILIILVLGSVEAYSKYKNPDKSYFNVDLKTKFKFSLMYFGLIAFLGTGLVYMKNFM